MWYVSYWFHENSTISKVVDHTILFSPPLAKIEAFTLGTLLDP